MTPVREALRRCDERLERLESARKSSEAVLREEMAGIRGAGDRLRDETARLTNALRSPNRRGRWGEIALRRLLELAGLSAHADFVEQPHLEPDPDERTAAKSRTGSLRPDVVVRLPGERCLVIDAKAPLDAALRDLEKSGSDRAEDGDEESRRRRQRRQAGALRRRVRDLASRAYWERLDESPDYVILFLPLESMLAESLEVDPDLLDDALARRVVPATPTTLLALLKAVAHGWRERRLAEEARELVADARRLRNRLADLGGAMTRVGARLDEARLAWDDVLRHHERDLGPTLRRLERWERDDDDASDRPSSR